MTRINTTLEANVFNHEDLLDQHLMIAYREITRIANLARHAKPGEKFPAKYTLGTGHMKFFYDKGEFLAKQCEELYQACIRRGFNVQHKQYKTHSFGLNNDWQPTKVASIENLFRLDEKLRDKPLFYKYYGKPVKPCFYANIIGKL